MEDLLPASHRGDSHDVVRHYVAPLDGSVCEPEVLYKIPYLEMKLRLPEHLLMRVDKLTMAHAVEARVPFLDHDVVDFATRLPPSYKLRDGVGKRILKKAAEPYRDHDIIYRRKQGFGAPMEDWFREGDFGRRSLAAFDRSSSPGTAFRQRLLPRHAPVDERLGRPQLPVVDRVERRAVARVVASKDGKTASEACSSVGTLAIAIAGLWLFRSGKSIWRACPGGTLSTNVLQAAAASRLRPHDAAVAAVHPRVFEIRGGTLTLATVTSRTAIRRATIRANGAHTAGITFDADVERGGVTIGIQQAGEWIAINSSENPGPFSGLNSALLGFRRSLMVTIANRNAAGASQVTIKSLRVYLRR